MKDWLNSVNKMARLNGLRSIRYTEDVIHALAFAYHKNLTPIEAVAFLRLVANKLGDKDPNEVRQIEKQAEDLMLIAKNDEAFRAGLVLQHLSRFIEIAAPAE